MYQELNLATDTIMITSWWWDSEFELIRDEADHHLLTPTERWDQEGFDIDLGDDANPDPLPLSWQPEGFVHTLQFRTLSDCLIENIGPDTF